MGKHNKNKVPPPHFIFRTQVEIKALFAFMIDRPQQNSKKKKILPNIFFSEYM